jgi:LytR cell envelope-related transcriptional attenuator
LEQPLRSRIRRFGLIAGLVLLTLALALAVRPDGPARTAHAYPVPGEREHLTAEVLNGTNRPGLARVATRVLRRGGIDVVFYGTADLPEVDSTLVLVRRGAKSSGVRVAGRLGLGRVRVEPDTLRRVDVTVILGADYVPPDDLHP